MALAETDRWYAWWQEGRPADGDLVVAAWQGSCWYFWTGPLVARYHGVSVRGYDLGRSAPVPIPANLVRYPTEAELAAYRLDPRAAGQVTKREDSMKWSA